MKHKYSHLVDKAVRPIDSNDFMILSRQLVINRFAVGGDWTFDRRSAKMLVVLKCGEQHIITFTLPGSHCTVKDLLRQIGVQFDSSTLIDALEHSGGRIHVVVTVGFIMKITTFEMVAYAEASYREMVEGIKDHSLTPPFPSPCASPAAAPAVDNNGNQPSGASASKSKKRKRHSSSGKRVTNGCSPEATGSAEATRQGKKHKKRRSTSAKSKDSISKELRGAVGNEKKAPGQAAEAPKGKKRKSSSGQPAAPRDNTGGEMQKLKESTATEGETPKTAKEPAEDDQPSVSKPRARSLSLSQTATSTWSAAGASYVSDSKPKAQSLSLVQTPTATWSAAGAGRTPEERAELSRLRRNRRWNLSQDCQDEEPVVLSSGSEDEGAKEEGVKNGEAADGNLTLVMYPPTGPGGLAISMKDYMCLGRGSFLNDIIIDFYLRWLKDNVIPEGQRERTHIFSTFFHKRLTTITHPINLKLTAAQRRHERVQKWTRSVDIFDKDFIIVPFNEQSHWILAIICFPSLRGPVAFGGDGDGTGAEESSGGVDGPIKQPVILIFDSLAVISRHRAIAVLRDYLTCEYRAKKPDGDAHVFTRDNMPGFRVDVPQQENLTDCGLYLLQYAEQFFTHPITDYSLPLPELDDWFDLLTVTKKREDLSILIQKLMDEGNHHQQRKVLPVIDFPTLNGELVEERVEEKVEEKEEGNEKVEEKLDKNEKEKLEENK
ncbi:hypothetical protein KR084_012234, partial [Drosophila pseudotakahashii]